MVDIELFRQILSNEEVGYIEEGDSLDYETIKLLATSKQDRVKKLFKKTSCRVPPIGYNCEFICEKCGNKFRTNIGKTKLFKWFGFINGSKPRIEKEMICKKCYEELRKKEIAEIEERKKYAISEKELKAQNTEEFIKRYLNPDNTWKKDVKNYAKLNDLFSRRVNWDVIKENIISMDYCDFLQTPYWKAIAEKIKIRANFKCQVCNSSENLVAHHRTYEHHGDELHYMEDLVCLCGECHEKYHFD